MKSGKKYIVLLLVFFAIFLYIRNISYLNIKNDFFAYVPYNTPLKCTPEQFLVKEHFFLDNLDNYPLKKWKISLLSMKQKQSMTSFLLTQHEDPYNVGTNVLMATDCTSLSSLESSPLNSTANHEIYLYDKKNNFIIKAKAYLKDDFFYIYSY